MTKLGNVLRDAGAAVDRGDYAVAEELTTSALKQLLRETQGIEMLVRPGSVLRGAPVLIHAKPKLSAAE